MTMLPVPAFAKDALPPMVNHLWQSTLYLLCEGIVAATLKKTGVDTLCCLAECGGQVSHPFLCVSRPG